MADEMTDRVDALLAEARERVRGVTFSDRSATCPPEHLSSSVLAAYLADAVERLRADARRTREALASITPEHRRALRQSICPAWDHHTDQQRRAIALANEAADVLERLALAAALAAPTPAAPGAVDRG